jgi:hypothetical protein
MMKDNHILKALALGLSLFGAAVASVAAQPVPARHIQVTACDPRPSYVAFPGYAPGYYLGPRYYWYDVYGYRYYQPPVPGSPTLAIEYTNVSPVAAKVVDFGLVARGSLIAEVRDVGTFSPNVEIKHEFGLSPNVFPIGSALVRCVPLYVEYVDGTHWTNPHLPALRRSIYPRG